MDTGVDAFISKFSGLTESYFFYDNSIELKYDPKEHIYFLVTPEGLEPQDGVTNVAHIIDKSHVLLPWACKMMEQKLLKSIPVIPSFEEGMEARVSLTLSDLEKLVRESKTAHKDKLEDAGAVGHMAHNYIEQWIKADIYDEVVPTTLHDERAWNCCIAALTWMKRHNIIWLGTERKVYSRTFKYAGTMDGLARASSCDDPKCCPVPFKDKLILVDWKTSNYLYIEYIFQTSAYKAAYEEEFGTSIEHIWIVRLGKEDAEFETWHLDKDLMDAGWNAFLAALVLTRNVGTVEHLVQEAKDSRKAIAKAERMAAKEAELKIKCKNADKYKGMRYPQCNGGNPCETCIKIYNERREQEITKVTDKTALTNLINLLDKE